MSGLSLRALVALGFAVSFACVAQLVAGTFDSPGATAEDKGALRKPEVLSGDWSGRYHYPDDGMASVKFDMKFAAEGAKFKANCKEPNTFGEPDAEFLFARCEGQFDEKTRKVTWTKTYDGTGGVNHSVEYSGEVSADGTKIEGMWAIGAFTGKFSLTKGKAKEKAPDPK